MRALIVVLSSLLLVAGCAAPAPSTRAADVAVAPQQASQSLPVAAPDKPGAGMPKRAPPMSDPLPPERVREPSRAPLQVDRTCRIDSDCVVKDIGSCCGYAPACVHKASATDPEGVRAQCARDGIASTCGFNEITACRCVRNQCVDEQEPVGGWMDDPPPPPPAIR